MWEHVCKTPTGFNLHRRKNKDGGHCYGSDEFGAIIWDTSIVSECDILCAIVEEHHRRMLEIHRSKK